MQARLQLKCSNNQSTESLLIKTFKYFDVLNRGELDLTQFIKAMDKLGLQSYSNDVYSRAEFKFRYNEITDKWIWKLNSTNDEYAYAECIQDFLNSIPSSEKQEIKRGGRTFEVIPD